MVVHEHPLAHRDRRPRAGLDHDPGRLVAQHDGGARVLVPGHQVAAAEAAGAHPHHQLAGPGRRVGALLELEPPAPW